MYTGWFSPSCGVDEHAIPTCSCFCTTCNCKISRNTQDRRGWGVVAGAQGTTMSGSRQLLEESNHAGMRGILRPCRYGTTWLKEGL
uniref:Uncharacterized protein n=1 Tax=Medicago truncatula TaxID=3880 RepID=A2Q3L0_MEDTR|nr:hypothetical protein MtrDRAFT_AC155885g2v2 [Medicago truncatula]